VKGSGRSLVEGTSWYLPGGTEKTAKPPSENSGAPGLDLNSGSAE
jgi:hypothetical protein